MSSADGIRAREATAGRAVPPFDGLLLGAVLLLAAIGLVMVYSASALPAGQSRRLGFDEFFYLKRQLAAAGAGLVLLAAALRIGHRRLALLAYPLLGLTLAALALVPWVGKTAGGAQRWIPVGPIQFQPAEAAKVVLVLYLAQSLARKQDRIRSFAVGVLPHLLVTGVLGSRTSSPPRSPPRRSSGTSSSRRRTGTCGWSPTSIRSATGAGPGTSSGSRSSGPRTGASSARGSARGRGSSSTSRPPTPTSSRR